MLEARIGTAPCNWNNDDIPDYRPITPVPTMLKEMVQAGYAATEVTSAFSENPEDVKKQLTAYGLAPASTFCALNFRDSSVRAADIAQAVMRAKFLAALGVDALIVADSGDDIRRAVAGHVRPENGLDDASWRNLLAGLAQLAGACAPLGVRLVFHNHVGTFVETELELRRLLEQTNPAQVGLCYDVGHMLYAGGDVQKLADDYADRIQYVHLKDVDMAVLQRCRRDKLGLHDALRIGIFTEFGTGGMDFPRFFSTLSRANYRGWLIVEQDTTKRTPLESAAINREYLRDILRQ